ncbi:unnamed protein product [Spirodela intermedia]|uniref:Integrase catalytic domain-containing protein n=1 Tax=Spirodela intermedia TaxID=51605 RepID=A0A7I8KW15_SPIIN|nr:unnamed protein product [Spirodela intermedia]
MIGITLDGLNKFEDAAQLYELKLKMMTMRQMKKSVTEYTHEVRTLWQEFDQYKIADMTDPFDAALYREEIERDRTFEYLVELNSEYDQVRIQILGREKLPPLNEVISLVRGEESCRNLMLGSQNSPTFIALSASTNSKSSPWIADSGMSGRTIGRAREWSGIYYLELPSQSNIAIDQNNIPKNPDLDVWGPASTPSTSGARWFITFIDDCTRMTWIYLLKNKSDVSMALIQFCSLIRTQFETTIQRFRSDNAKDYFNHTLTSYFQKEGIVHESSYVYTPQQNGVAERKNGHLLGMTKALIIQNNIPKYFWGEGVPMAAHLINRLPTKSLNFKSSIDMLSFFYPHILLKTNLISRIFGCTAFVHIHEQHRDKLDPRALKWVRECTKKSLYLMTLFLSYNRLSPSHKAFVFNLNSTSIPKTVFEALTH